MKWLILAASLSLVGCKTLDVPGGDGFQVDYDLLVPCGDEALMPDNPTPEQVLAVHRIDGKVNGDCRKRFKIMQDSYKEYRKRIGKTVASQAQ